MIVEIMQSHVDSGKWYLQHQPTHPRADALLAADSGLQTNISENYQIHMPVLENGAELVIGCLPIPSLDTSLQYWRRLYHHQTRQCLKLRDQTLPASLSGRKGQSRET